MEENFDVKQNQSIAIKMLIYIKLEQLEVTYFEMPFLSFPSAFLIIYITLLLSTGKCNLRPFHYVCFSSTAPEIATGDGYSHAVDWYALGVLAERMMLMSSDVRSQVSF